MTEEDVIIELRNQIKELRESVEKLSDYQTKIITGLHISNKSLLKLLDRVEYLENSVNSKNNKEECMYV
jgi:cell division protein ZapA (FtsZ GTPase activity inhibitor)